MDYVFGLGWVLGAREAGTAKVCVVLQSITLSSTVVHLGVTESILSLKMYAYGPTLTFIGCQHCYCVTCM